MENDFKNIENKIDTLVNSVSILSEHDRSIKDTLERLKDSQHAVEIKVEKLDTSINWLKWVIPILVTVGIFFTGQIVSSLKDNINFLRENNSMQIQKEVSQTLWNSFGGKKITVPQPNKPTKGN